MPAYATAASAGLDLRAAMDAPLTLQPGDARWCRRAWRSISPIRPCARWCCRAPDSAISHGIVLGNGTGLIDADYQGPLLISLWNRGREPFTIEPGDRIAQLVVVPIVRAALQVVDTFEDSERGSGGFGHTGVR